MRAGTDPGRPGDHRRGVDPRGVVRRGMKHLDGPREIEVGIRGTQRGDAHEGLVRREENGRSARGVQRGAILSIGEKRQMAGLRFVDASDAGDFKIRVTFDGAVQFPRELG